MHVGSSKLLSSYYSLFDKVLTDRSSFDIIIR